jgi:hypothetical protein
MGSPTDEMCQLMVYPLELFIRWEMIFKEVNHRKTGVRFRLVACARHHRLAG